MIIVTQKTARLARQYKLKPEELAFADLIAAGWDDADAYAVTIRTGATTWTKKALSEEYDRLASLEGIRRRIEDRKQEQDKADHSHDPYVHLACPGVTVLDRTGAG